MVPFKKHDQLSSCSQKLLEILSHSVVLVHSNLTISITTKQLLKKAGSLDHQNESGILTEEQQRYIKYSTPGNFGWVEFWRLASFNLANGYQIVKIFPSKLPAVHNIIYKVPPVTMLMVLVLIGQFILHFINELCLIGCYFIFNLRYILETTNDLFLKPVYLQMLLVIHCRHQEARSLKVKADLFLLLGRYTSANGAYREALGLLRQLKVIMELISVSGGVCISNVIPED